MNRTKASAELQVLKSSCRLLSHISERHLLELELQDAIRIYRLDDGDSIILKGGTHRDSLYVMSGQVRVQAGNRAIQLDADRHQCRPLTIEQGRQLQLVANGPVTLCRTDRSQIDFMIGWAMMLDNLDDSIEAGIREKLAALNNPMVFMRLPFENVVRAFERMQRVRVSAGEDVVVQGEPGERFYIIEKGRAEIWKSGPYDDVQKKILELGRGDQFGEEALVSGGSRNATVRMITDGNLLSLSRADFEVLIKTPLVKAVDANVAAAMHDSGYVMIDVRYEEEWEDAHIPEATLIPLHELRRMLPRLDRGKRYLTYCLSGKRSAVAAMIMKQSGFDVMSLQDGLRSWPYETVSAAA